MPPKTAKSLIYLTTIMKKLTTLLTIAFLSLMTFSLTSCDEDHEIAFELDGTWRGQVESNKGPFYVDIRFHQSGFSKHGTGYEYDEAVYGYGESYANFNWSVDDGCIYMNYDDGSHVVIANYTLRNGQLSGYLQNGRTGWKMGYIHLVRLSNNSYDSSYNRYYSKKNQLIDDSNSEGTKETEE